MEVKLVKSNKGGEKIFIDNFGYHFRSKNATDEYRWVCTYRKSMYCRSSVLTKKIGDKHIISRPPTKHNHSKLDNENVLRKYMKAFWKAKRNASSALETENVASTCNDGKMLKIKEEPLSPEVPETPLEQDETSKAQEPSPVELEKDLLSNSDQMEYETIAIQLSPAHRPLVLSQQEPDGTVNIRIFLEESLLSSFVIDTHYTSNVNIRISKEEFQRTAGF